MNTVLVTGGSKGIGSAIAEEFASLGYAVAINYNKSEEKAKALSLELMKKYKVPVGAYKADVKNKNEVAEMITKIKDELNQILAAKTGQSLDKIYKDTDRDFYMTAKEAKDYGIIDDIITN